MLFRPRYTIDTIYHLDPKQLKKMEIKAVFSDLDNTLLAWNKAETAVEMDELNQRLAKDGIRLVVISNNNAELKALNLKKDQVLMVGDQLITDIQAGNLAGVTTVLVKPLVETDKWNTRINRFFEKFIFFFLNLRKPVVFKEKLE